MKMPLLSIEMYREHRGIATYECVCVFMRRYECLLYCIAGCCKASELVPALQLSQE